MDGINADFAGSDYWSLKAQSTGEFAIFRGGAEKFRIDTDNSATFAGAVTATGGFSGSGASLTALPAAQLTGALPAIDGSNLTGNGLFDNFVCHLKTDISTAIAQGVANEFTVNFNLEEHNDSGKFSHSSGVITVTAAGWYRVYANMVYENATSSARNTIRAYVEKNGTEITSTRTYDYDRGSSYGKFSNNKIETMLYLAANDTIAIGNYAYNEDGSASVEAAECEFIVNSVTVTTTATNADTVDGLHASSFLRSDANDSTSGTLTIQGHDFKNHNDYNLIVQSNGANSGGICQEDSSGNFIYQVYGSTGGGGQYGFLDSKWGAWDIKKTKNGAFEVDEGSGLQRVWNAGNDGAGSGLDADTLDGIQSGSFLRADTGDEFSGQLVSTARNNGIFGEYDSYKTDHIWSMGAAYKNASDGSDFGNLYGLAYKHTNNTTGGTMGGSHQMVWCINGVGKGAIGNDIWTQGDFKATSSNHIVWHAGNDGSGSGLDADLLDGKQDTQFLRSDAADTAGSDITFSGGAGAVTVAAASDIRIAGGTWTGEYTGGIKIQANSSDSYIQYQGTLYLRATNSNNRFSINQSGSATFDGTVSDSKGNLRSIPKNNQANAYTLVAADAGKFIEAENGVTIPSSVFSAGDAVTIVNQTGSDITLTSGSGLTLYNAADASTGNRTLASRGLATVLYASGSTAHISGAGLS